jgi:hypothetical protein
MMSNEKKNNNNYTNQSTNKILMYKRKLIFLAEG